jgi:hypothetical protein
LDAVWQANEEMINRDGTAPPFLCCLMPLVEVGIVANKSIDFIGFKYAVVTSLV